MKKQFNVLPWGRVIAKKCSVIASTLGCVAISLPLVLVGCDDSSSGSSNDIPAYGNEAALPNTCELEVAKAGDSYFACLENKWVAVTDSAFIEKIRDGLDGDKLKAELEELVSKQPGSSTESNEDDSSSSIGDEDPESSSGTSEVGSSGSELPDVSSASGDNSSASVDDESSSSVAGGDPESSSGTSEEESSSSGSNEQTNTCNGAAYNANTHFCAKRSSTEERAYKFVTIASASPAYSKTWMAENLSYQTEKSWCGGGTSGTTTAGDCSVYGRLYTWAAAMGKTEDECGYGHDCTTLGTDNVQGVCPDGWHVPTQNEWDDLIVAMGGQSTAGQKLKAQAGWTAYSDITNEDTYGFSALPAGYRSYYGDFGSAGLNAYFWSSTEVGSDDAYHMYLSYGSDNVRLSYNYGKDYGFSVRCLKDSE